MELTSLSFVGFSLAVVLAANAFGDIRARQAILAVASAAFIASYATEASQLLPLGLFLLACFAALRAVQLWPTGAVLGGGLAVVVGAFLYLKQYSFVAMLPTMPLVYLTLGLSYILFRVVHLMVDAKQGDLPERIGPLAFFNYTCNFLSFVSGPIQRYPDSFAARREPVPALDPELVFAAFARVVKGYLKVAAVSVVANYAFEHLSARLFEQATGAGLVQIVIVYSLTVAIYTAYLYANFSGYMDIVIGIGRLFGCDLPENFDRPFRARNFLEFWSRWHMTLSDWFKTYVFNPLLKLMAARVHAPALQPWLGVVAFFLTFLLMGIWHGSTQVFLYYGLAMGLGASLNKLWQVHMHRRLGKQGYKTLAANPIYAALCRGMTFAWFALALTCFWVDMTKLERLASALGAGGALASFALLSVGGGVALSFTDRVLGWIEPVAARLMRLRGELPRNMSLAAGVLLIVAVGTVFHRAPEFVYRAF